MKLLYETSGIPNRVLYGNVLKVSPQDIIRVLYPVTTSAPIVWDALPTDLQAIKTTISFKHTFKTHLLKKI